MSTTRDGTIDREYATRLAITPPEHDGPVWMVNLMKYREVAEYTDGRESAISGREADDEYSPVEILGRPAPIPTPPHTGAVAHTT